MAVQPASTLRPAGLRPAVSLAARQALELVDANPTMARELALRALGGDLATSSRAERVLGLVEMRREDYGHALRHLRRAVRLAERAGAPRYAAEARMTLSLALAYRGDTETALLEIERAGPALRGVAAARLQMQRAMILQRLGRLDESLDGYRRALPAIRRAGDRLVEARLLANRGVLHVYRGDLGAAAADLEHSERICIEDGHDRQLGVVRQNLGFVAAQRGDVPRALEHYDEAERVFRSLDAPQAVLHRDRCEALLSVCLADEARKAAERAVEELTRAGMSVDVAEARLMLAEAALAERDPETAMAAAKQALKEFRRQRRPTWVALARYVVLKAEWAGSDGSRRLLTTAVQTADALADAGWAIASVDARLVAAQVALELGDGRRAETLLAETRTARTRGPAELRARAWHAEALSRLLGGDARGADRALNAGLRVIDEHRALIGARELRTHVTGHAVELAALGLRTAVAGGEARRVLAWAERCRARSLLVRPARPPDDPHLIDDLARLRQVASDHEAGTLAGRDTRELARLQRQLELAIRDRSRRAAGTGTRSEAGCPPLPELSDVLGDRALVEYVQVDGELHAVALAGRRTALQALGPEAAVARSVDSLRFGLHRLARGRGSAGSRDAALQSVRDSARTLDRLLIEPLRGTIGERELVVVPTGALHLLPWSLLPSCAPQPLVVAPSARLWFEKAVHGEIRALAARQVFVAGPRVPHADAEATGLALFYERSRLLLGEDANVEAVKAVLDGAGVAHIAAHGSFRADNPLFSSLLLADGPLTVYDLETLGSTPRLLILSACDSALSAVRPGDELMGLAAAFLTLGTRSLIASVTPVPDMAARRLMLAVHSRLRVGVPPRVALSIAQREIAGTGYDGLAAAAGFVCLGAS